MKKAMQRFYYIKRLLNSDNDTKELLDYSYYNSKAITFVQKLKFRYNLNLYYDLSISDVLDLINEHKNLNEVKKYLFNEFRNDYALCWYRCLIDYLEREI